MPARSCAEREWGPGLAGISQGIYSVISDYSTTDYAVRKLWPLVTSYFMGFFLSLSVII